MEYTIARLAQIAGVSTRTLRYYDQIGLLSPVRINSSGYRIYGEEQVDTLQQILFYRELDMELEDIKRVMSATDYDRKKALQGHLLALNARRTRLDALIDTIKKTIHHEEEGTHMSNQEKFEGFKKKLIEENEQKYGEEIREKYGDDTIDESNRKMMNLTKEQYDKMTETAAEMQKMLEDAVTSGESPEGELGAKLTQMHKEWLTFAWPKYTEEAHKGVTQMYVDDERFTAYYDKTVSGCAKFLRDAVHAHLK